MRNLILLIFVLAVSINNAQTAFSKPFDEAANALNDGNYSGAIEKLSKAIAHKDEASSRYKVADAYIYRGYCRYMLNNFSAAISDIDEALKIKPEYSKGYSFKTTVYLAMQDFDKCLEWCNKGLEYSPNNEDILINKAKAQMGLKKYENSRNTLRQVVYNDPKNTSALRYIASSFQSQHLWDSSIVYFSKVIEIDPLDQASFFDRGIGKSFLKDYDSAKEDVEKGMKLDTSMRFVGYNNIGFFMKLEQKDYAGAIEYFNKAIALAPKFAYAYSNRGFSKLCLGDVEGALKDVKKSLELDNTNSYAHKNLGLVNLKRNKKKEACENFKKALELGYTEQYDDEVEKLMKENCQ